MLYALASKSQAKVLAIGTCPFATTAGDMDQVALSVPDGTVIGSVYDPVANTVAPPVEKPAPARRAVRLVRQGP